MNKQQITLEPTLDTAKISKSDILDIQKLLNKHPLKLTPDMNKDELLNAIKDIVPELEAELKKFSGIDIKVNDNSIVDAINQIGKKSNVASSSLKQMQDWLNLNTKTLQELKDALLSYQTALSNTDNADSSTLTNIENIVGEIEKIQKMTTTLKNVGRGRMFPLIHCLCCKFADYNMCSLGY